MFICQLRGSKSKKISNLLGELDGFNLDESSSHCLHVGLGIAEGDTAASNGVPGQNTSFENRD